MASNKAVACDLGTEAPQDAEITWAPFSMAKSIALIASFKSPEPSAPKNRIRHDGYIRRHSHNPTIH